MFRPLRKMSLALFLTMLAFVSAGLVQLQVNVSLKADLFEVFRF